MIARLLPTRYHRGLALIAILALISLAYSAHATHRAIAAHGRAAVAAPLDATGFEAEDHFPGAAYFYAVDDDAAPAAGTTGTAALPDLPIPSGASFDVNDGTVQPARPFSMANASATDRGRALQCLASAIYYEAASQSDDGQRAVAQVVLNRVRHPVFPDTVCGVVYQGSARASGCQFSFACDGALARRPSPTAWAKAQRFAAEALGGYVFAPVGLATHYHTYAVTPAWNRELVMTDAIGAHLFHRWAGYWGTPAAFNQVYHGGEPSPGPVHSIPGPDEAPAVVAAGQSAETVAATSAAVPSPTSPPVALAMVKPAYADSGVARTAPQAATDALPQSRVLDRWKDSGRPLQ